MVEALPHVTYECRTCGTSFEIHETGDPPRIVSEIHASCPVCNGEDQFVGRAD